MAKSLGIDLGTTNTVVSYLDNGKFGYLSFGRDTSLPSCLLYKDEKIDVGTRALKKSIMYADHFIKSSKTFMGDFRKTWMIDNRTFTPTEVASQVLKKVKEEAVKQLGDGEFDVVITVPAYFNANQREETKKAGIEAGLNVKQIVTEPVSAAVAYGFEDSTQGLLFVVDIGGGTFDVSILKLNNGHFETIEIAGDAKLGGDDFDEVILERLYSEVRKKTGVDLEEFEQSGLSKEDYSKACQTLIGVAEEVKIALSSSSEYEVSLLNIVGNSSYSFVFTREEFEDSVRSLLSRIRKTIKNCLSDADISASEIDKIILVGGTSKIPAIQALVEEEFGKLPYADRDLSKLVAMGAALLAEDDETITVKDIIAHSLGIEVYGNKFEKILYRNSQYPITAKKEFTTTYDYQTEVLIAIFEGENENEVDQNSYSGSFILPNIEKAKKGIPRIEVEFSFDESQTLQVTARDLNTGSSIKQTVQIDKGERREKPESKPYDIALMLDRSYSMEGEDIIQAKKACVALVSEMIDLNVNRVGFISFDHVSKIHSHLTHDADKLVSEITRIQVSGSTNMAGAIKDAYDVLNKGANERLAILVTDGAPDSISETELYAKKLKSAGARLITIGVGYGVNEQFLTNIATSKSDYYFVENMEDLHDIFEEITAALQVV